MKYIIANWKMKLSAHEEHELALQIVEHSFNPHKVYVSINPSFLSLQRIGDLCKNSDFALGAQDCFFEDNGAYTGEISPKFLSDLDVENVIIGHSERRHYLGESNTIINKKIHAALDDRLIPIVCVGESAQDRESGSQDHVVRRQVELCLHNLEMVGTQKLLIAYEPVWAIGTGRPATVKDVIYMHKVIYHTLLDLFPKGIVANNIFVLYGGSVDSLNISEFLKAEVVDGVLVGSTSLKKDEYIRMITKAENT